MRKKSKRKPKSEEAIQKIREAQLARWGKIKKEKLAKTAKEKELKHINPNKDIRQQLADWLGL